MKTIAKPWIAEIGVYEPGKPIEEVAREMGFKSADEIIKLASNENALGPSPLAVEAMKRAACLMHRYPDGSAYHLRNALAEKLKVDPAQILVGNGSNELIEFIGHVFLETGVDMVMAEYSFAIYRLVAGMFQAGVISVPMRNYTHDLDAMLDAITSETKIVFIANPNNPTGTIVGSDDLDRFMSRVPDNVVVCIDEAYIELLPAELQLDTLKYVKNGCNVILLRSFAKSYGLAGLRVGYAVAQEDAIALMQRVRQPFNVNSMALAAAQAALKDETHLRKTRKMIQEGFLFFEEHLSQIGVPYVPSVVNFLLVEVGQGRVVFQKMQKEGVIVRPMDGYGLPRHVRITIGTREENERCIHTLSRVLGNF